MSTLGSWGTGIRAGPGAGGGPVPELGFRSLHPARLPRDYCRQLWGCPWEGIGLGEAWDMGWRGAAGLARARGRPLTPVGCVCLPIHATDLLPGSLKQ